MNQFSPHAPRVGVLAVSPSLPAWAKPLLNRWSSEGVWIGQTGEEAWQDGRWPDLLLLVGEGGMDGSQWPSAARIAASASAQGSLVLGVVLDKVPARANEHGLHDLHGLIEVVSPTLVDVALDALLRLMLLSGVVRLEMEELDAFMRQAPSVRLSVGRGEPGQAGVKAAMANAIQEPHKTALAAPVGCWLVGILSDASLGATGFNAAGEWLSARVADEHEITVIASCDEGEAGATGVVVLACH